MNIANVSWFFLSCVVLRFPPDALNAAQDEKPAAKQIARVFLHSNVHSSLSQSGKLLATVAEDGQVTIWSTQTRQEIVWCISPHDPRATQFGKAGVYEGGYARVVCFDRSNDGLVYFMTSKGFYQWEWKDRKRPVRLYSAKECTKKSPLAFNSFDLACSRDGKLVVHSDRAGNLTLFPMKPQKKPRSCSSRNGSRHFCEIDFLGNSRDIVHIFQGKLLKYNPNSGKDAPIGKVGDDELIFSLAVSSDGDFIAASTRERVLLWNMTSGKCVCFADHKPDCVVAFSHDGRFLAVGGLGTLSLYSVGERKKLASVKAPASGFMEVGFLKDDRTIFGIVDSPTVKYWSWDKGNGLAEIKD